MYDSETLMNPCYNCPLMMAAQFPQQQYMEAPTIEMNEQDDEGEENPKEDPYRRPPYYGHGPYPRPRPRPRPFFGFPFYPFRPPYQPYPHYPYY